MGGTHFSGSVMLIGDQQQRLGTITFVAAGRLPADCQQTVSSNECPVAQSRASMDIVSEKLKYGWNMGGLWVEHTFLAV